MAETLIALRASASQGVGTVAAEPNYIGANRFVAAIVEIEYVSGSGTLDVWLQRRLPSGMLEKTAVFEDLARITQLAAAGKRIFTWVAAGEEEYAPTDATLTAGQIRNGPLGTVWRLKSTVGSSAVVWKATAALYF